MLLLSATYYHTLLLNKTESMFRISKVLFLFSLWGISLCLTKIDQIPPLLIVRSLLWRRKKVFKKRKAVSFTVPMSGAQWAACANTRIRTDHLRRQTCTHTHTHKPWCTGENAGALRQRVIWLIERPFRRVIKFPNDPLRWLHTNLAFRGEQT